MLERLAPALVTLVAAFNAWMAVRYASGQAFLDGFGLGIHGMLLMHNIGTLLKVVRIRLEDE